MKKLLLESLHVESFETTPAHHDPSVTMPGYLVIANQFTEPQLTADTTLGTDGTLTGTSPFVTGSPNGPL